MSREYPCVYHKEGGYCTKFEEPGFISWCVYGPCSHETPSNGDRIRAMSDEEMGKFLGEWAEKPWAWKRDGEGECLAWLQEPAEKPKEG